MALTWKILLHHHYITNIILAASFYVAKISPALCNKVFPNAELSCSIEWREYEILCFVVVVIVFKNKRAPSWLSYVTTSLQFIKVGNVMLFYRQEPRHGILFAVLCLLHFMFSTEPNIKGAELITQFNETSLELELNKSRDIVWLIEFYTPWSVMSQQFAPVFSQLANRYSLPNFKFGKIDANRYENTAKKYKIDSAATSKMLPTIMLVKHGREVKRRPFVDYKGRIQRYVFTEDNICADFDLANVHNECKKCVRGGGSGGGSAGGESSSQQQTPGDLLADTYDDGLPQTAASDGDRTRLANQHLMDRVKRFDG